MIPLVDLSAQHAAIRKQIESGLRSVMNSGRFILGPNVAEFEQEAARYLGVEHAVSCASGTDALHLALVSLGVGPGDEVITTPFTFAATAEAIRHVGARPVFVDIEPDTFNIDPVRVEPAVTPATRVLLPVHLFGQPAAMERLAAVAATHGLHLIEDCAQCFGAVRGDQRAGTIGVAGCFSFFPTKNLGACGDGGMVATDSSAMADTLHELRNHGGPGRGEHRVVGYNSRLDELQAVILREKLHRVDGYNRARRAVARRYTEGLADLPGVVTPTEDPGGIHVYHQYTVLLPDRDSVRRVLDERGIGCAAYYERPLHRQPAFAANGEEARVPVAEEVARRCLSLPMYPELSGDQIDAVVDAVRSAVAA